MSRYSLAPCVVHRCTTSGSIYNLQLPFIGALLQTLTVLYLDLVTKKSNHSPTRDLTAFSHLDSVDLSATFGSDMNQSDHLNLAFEPQCSENYCALAKTWIALNSLTEA